MVQEQMEDDIIEELEATLGDPFRVIDRDGAQTWLHECVTDRSYSLLEAATLLDQLSEHTETDSGLWMEQEPRDAIATQAAFTYRNAVYSIARSIIEDVVHEYDSCEQGEDEEDDAWAERAREHVKQYIEGLS
jgi:hypothetical protein